MPGCVRMVHIRPKRARPVGKTFVKLICRGVHFRLIADKKLLFKLDFTIAEKTLFMWSL
jgi:hypothetical protein